MANKVFIVQEVPGRNLLPAMDYGELHFLLPPGNIAYSSAPTVRRLKQGLHDFSDDDYLLMMGDPAAIAIAGAIAAQTNMGRMNLLKWDRQEHRYYEVQFDIHGRQSDD